ncbi:MAG: Rieske (2Fe-2S) protein [Deltaproteobacteria bacterium]|nr:Rieske (2Fe-2S) protein [Deltaproteobacteria bacterium]MBN2671436.1 Rieske (2Fe-2S) protein [Deltaproteobacteria bacterium]
MQKRTFLKYMLSGAVATAGLLSGRGAWAKKYAIALNKLPALNDVGGSVTIKLGGRHVLLVRLSQTEYRAFEGLCTHQSCPVSYVKKQISCECHGSHFDLNGKVKSGPATRPLATIPVKVQGDKLIVGE